MISLSDRNHNNDIQYHVFRQCDNNIHIKIFFFSSKLEKTKNDECPKCKTTLKILKESCLGYRYSSNKN